MTAPRSPFCGDETIALGCAIVLMLAGGIVTVCLALIVLAVTR